MDNEGMHNSFNLKGDNFYGFLSASLGDESFLK